MGSPHQSLRPLVIEKWDVDLVKPSTPTPIVSLSLSTIDNDPYIETLAKTIYVYNPHDSVGDTTDPASLLQRALSKALVYYYPLAGKIRRRSQDGRLELNCNAGDGVPFIRANAECTLSSVVEYVEGGDVDKAYELVPDYEAERDCDCTDGYKPLAVQVTRFRCGGFTIGMALSHSVCDGFGAAQFFLALAELAAGQTNPTVLPVWDRQLLTSLSHGEVDGDSDPKLLDFSLASLATSPYTPTSDMVREIVNVSPEDITRLKIMIANEVSKEEKMISVTTLEVVAAYMWRARCRALKLNPDGITVFGLAVGIRGVVEPALPEGYYGNAFVKANLALRARDLRESQLYDVVKLIKGAKRAALEKGYVGEQLRETERTLTLAKKTKGAWECGNAALMLLTDWRQLGLMEEVDFGWKETMDIIPLVALNLMEICILLPPSKKLPSTKGGVRMLLTLPRSAMPDFRQEMDMLCSSSTHPTIHH